MRTLLSSYALFSRLICEEKIFKDNDLSFDTVCDYIGADAAALDSLLTEELGMTGQELLSCLRTVDN